MDELPAPYLNFHTSTWGFTMSVLRRKISISLIYECIQYIHFHRLPRLISQVELFIVSEEPFPNDMPADLVEFGIW
jgi:hypothetical protein